MMDTMPVDTVIRAVTVLAGTRRPDSGYPDDPDAFTGEVAFLARHAIGIRDGAIAWVAPDDEVTAEEVDGARVIDGTGRLAMPGMMNGHTHAPMTMFRGAAEDLPAERWFNEAIWPMEVNLTDRDVELGAQLAVGEMLLAGVTTFADHYFATDRIARVVEAAGARAVLASTFFGSDGQAGVDRSAAFVETWNGAAGGRITTMMGPHATYTVEDEWLAAAADRARELGVRVHVHASETSFQTEQSLAARGVTPIRVLHDTGILDAGAIIAHGTGIVDSDIEWLAPVADRVGVPSSHKGYLKMGHGVTPVRMLHDAGVDVGVATDGPASHNTLDMFEAVRTMSIAQKGLSLDANWFTSAHALDVLFRQSARVLGLGDVLGALTPGHRADVVLIDLSAPHLQPMHDLAAALVMSVRPSDVRTVLVDGEVVVDEGRLLTLDLAEAIRELNERVPALTDRSHGRSIQTYAP